MKSVISILAGACLTIAAGSASFAADVLQVTSSSMGTSNAASVVAKQLGFFDEAGLDVTLLNAGGGNNAVSTVVGGSAQIAIVGINNASKPAEKGQPLTLVAGVTKGFGQVIFVRKDLYDKSGLTENSSLAEKGAFLKGKTIAVNDVGGSSGNFARYVLKESGLTDRDASIININSDAARLTALKNKSIDGIVASSPDPEIAIAGGYGTVLVNPQHDIPSLGQFVSTINVVRSDYLAEHRDVIERFLRAEERGRRYVLAHPDEARTAFYAFIQSQSSAPSKDDDEVTKLAWSNFLGQFVDTPVISQAQYAGAQKFFGISESLTFDKFIDTSLAQKIAAEK